MLASIIHSWNKHEYTDTWEGQRRLCGGWGALLPLQVDCHPPAQVHLDPIWNVGAGYRPRPLINRKLGFKGGSTNKLGEEPSDGLPQQRRGTASHVRRVYANHRD